MATFDPSQPTTELEAVNTMRVAIGEPPLPSNTVLTSITDADVVTALNTLGKVAREVLSEGWKFNTMVGIEVLPMDTYRWTDNASYETELNVFKVPQGYLSWSLTSCPENGDLDMVERMSTGYRQEGSSVPVMYDRTYNRDGARSDRYKSIYIDGIVAVQFENLPEAARRYIAIRAARQFASQVVGSQELVGFTFQDEVAALRTLKRLWGIAERINFLEGSLSAWQWIGGRPHSGSGRQRRVYRGGN